MSAKELQCYECKLSEANRKGCLTSKTYCGEIKKCLPGEYCVFATIIKLWTERGCYPKEDPGLPENGCLVKGYRKICWCDRDECNGVQSAMDETPRPCTKGTSTKSFLTTANDGTAQPNTPTTNNDTTSATFLAIPANWLLMITPLGVLATNY